MGPKREQPLVQLLFKTVLTLWGPIDSFPSWLKLGKGLGLALGP